MKNPIIQRKYKNKIIKFKYKILFDTFEIKRLEIKILRNDFFIPHHYGDYFLSSSIINFQRARINIKDYTFFHNSVNKRKIVEKLLYSKISFIDNKFVGIHWDI